MRLISAPREMTDRPHHLKVKNFMRLKMIAASASLFCLTLPSMANAQQGLVSPLTPQDLNAMSGGMSCVAMNGPKTVFYDDGAAIIRVNGSLVHLGKHDMVPAKHYMAAGGALHVYLSPRPGRKKVTEEGALEPMTLKVVYGNITQNIPVMMNCSA